MRVSTWFWSGCTHAIRGHLSPLAAPGATAVRRGDDDGWFERDPALFNNEAANTRERSLGQNGYFCAFETIPRGADLLDRFNLASWCFKWDFVGIFRMVFRAIMSFFGWNKLLQTGFGRVVAKFGSVAKCTRTHAG